MSQNKSCLDFIDYYGFSHLSLSRLNTGGILGQYIGMGVKNLHKFVQNRAQEAVLRQNLSDYLQSYSWGHGPRCLVIDGQNFAYTIVKETHSPGIENR